MKTGVDKVGVMSSTLEQWRQHYFTSSEHLRVSSTFEKKADRKRERAIAIERRQTALACMAATILLHDRAVIEVTERRKKIREDFEREGMVLPGYRLAFIGDRPVAVPVDAPLVFKTGAFS